ncbi:hypothetical protein N7444_002857 [Penicillium canescens]|nr:hypothetical protein N7444_002857 [Penicillium canescens]
MLQTPTICDIPTEILLIIAHHLDAFSLIWLQRSCRLFREIIPSPTHLELIEAEITPFGNQNDLYACQDCLRLRPRAKFADNMVKRKKAKWGCKATERWCVDCGINPRPGTNRYTAGNIIGNHLLSAWNVANSEWAPQKTGTRYLYAKSVGDLREQSRSVLRLTEHGMKGPVCELNRLNEEPEDVRWGSASDSDEIFPPSPTSSEEYMEMIQAEAATYMNSPGPGSD